MVYQRLTKLSSLTSLHKKESTETAANIPLPTKSVSAASPEQEMPSYTPLAANWATNNNLMRSMSGNQVVQRQQESGEEEMEPIQAKLTIGQVGDKYEQEADQTAQLVVNQINAPAPQQSTPGQSLQREEMPEEEELQMKPMVQRQSDSGGMAATPDLEASIQQAKGGGQPLADNIREPMEKAFGADFSGVNVHTDAQSDQLNQSIQAKAFTTGQDVFFRQGAYDSSSRGGQELIAHELTHVVQQNGQKAQISAAPDDRIQRVIEKDEKFDPGKWLQEHPKPKGLKPFPDPRKQKKSSGISEVTKELDFSNPEEEKTKEKSALKETENATHQAKLRHIKKTPLSEITSDFTSKGRIRLHVQDINDEQEKKFLNDLVDEFVIYRGLLGQFDIGGSKLIDNLIASNSVENYISEVIIPHFPTLDSLSNQYLNHLRKLEKSENLFKRTWHKIKPNQRIKDIKHNKDFIKKFISQLPEEKEKAQAFVKKAITEKAKYRPDFTKKIEGRKKKIKEGVKNLNPELAKSIKTTNKGIKNGQEKIKKTKGNLSGAYLVPNGFFKPLSQSPAREGLKPGYQAIREILAYELSEYMKDKFGQDLGIAKTGLAALTSDEFAHGGVKWNRKMGGGKYKQPAVPEAEMPEQLGVWQERLNIDKDIEHSSPQDLELDSPSRQKEVQQIAFFDLMTGNYDRHHNNLVFDKNGKLRPIDHGEMLPDLKLYTQHNHLGRPVGEHLAWSKLEAANTPFSKEFQDIADRIDPDDMIASLEEKVAQIASTSEFAFEVADQAITEESWQLMRLHIIALKEGIKAALSPKELAQIFAGQGEVKATFSELAEQRKTQQSDFTQDQLKEAEEKVREAIKEGTKRMLAARNKLAEVK